MLGALLPRADDVALFLQAYFDESGRSGGVFCVAGYVLKSTQVSKFDASWRRMLGPIPAFHMTDLWNTRQDFKDFTADRRDRMIKRAVEIVNARCSLGFAASCNKKEFKALSPPSLPMHQDPYPLLCHLCVMRIGRLLQEKGLRGKVAYFFESGNQYQAQANRMMEVAQRDPEVQRFSRYRGHSFLDKVDATPLQAADLFAWEWAKFFDETVTRDERAMRKSLRALIENDPSRYQASHITGEPLRRYFRQAVEMGLYTNLFGAK